MYDACRMVDKLDDDILEGGQNLQQPPTRTKTRRRPNPFLDSQSIKESKYTTHTCTQKHHSADKMNAPQFQIYVPFHYYLLDFKR